MAMNRLRTSTIGTSGTTSSLAACRLAATKTSSKELDSACSATLFLGRSDCKRGATYANNVHGDGSTCGGAGEVASSTTTIRSGYMGYVGSIATNNNWHLNSKSVLLDKGSPSSYPSADRDGKRRFAGRAPDAGPYEFH